MRTVLVFLFIINVVRSDAQPPCYEQQEHPLPSLSAATKKIYETKLAEAGQQFRQDSSIPANIIWMGRRKAYLGYYQDAINLFSRGMVLHPGDPRLYRHRGHRYITLRCFDKAIGDLEKAAALIHGKPDETEPDGIPNAKNTPVSSLQNNIWYHLGLAYFLKGEFEKAQFAYEKGMEVSNNDDMQIAMANWLYISLLSQGKINQAHAVYDTLNLDAILIENGDYLSLLYFYRHKPSTQEILRYTDAVITRTAGKMDTTSVSAATLYFGAGYYAKLNGMHDKAILLFKKAMATGQWASFGYIAAEAVLNRKD